ncbi:MAG: alpha/beta hydrolase fold domain-containing protein [Clostridium sp.]
MKKIFKLTFLILLITIICSGVIFRHKISLIYNLSKKYIDLQNNNTLSSVDLDPLDNMDYKDVVYKERNGKQLTLDIYASKNEKRKKSPVILYVHGGSWIYGDKSIPSALSPILETFREEGYTIISTSYELLNKNISFEEQASDVKDTLKWISKNADKYGLDINNVGVIGTSSGAHLSLLACYSNENEFIGDKELNNYPARVDYIIDLFGPTDLTTLNMSLATWDMQQVLSKIPNKEVIMNKYSPINYVKEKSPNILIVHSKKDEIVPYDNALKLYDKNVQMNNKATLLSLELSEHDLSTITDDDIKNFIIGMLKFIVFNTPN